MEHHHAQSRTSRIIDEFFLFDAVDEVEGIEGDVVVDLDDDEILSSAGGPYRWDPLATELGR